MAAAPPKEHSLTVQRPDTTAVEDGELRRRARSSITETRILGPQTHRLPFKIMWSINLLTAVTMALLNFFMVLAIGGLVSLKFWAMQLGFDRYGTSLGIFLLTAVSTCFALIMVCLIQFIAPNCGGSGVPENKTYINGGSMPGFYTKRTLFVRVTTNILANAAGFPVGREGPMVTIGSNVAFKISKFLAKSYVKEWVDVQLGRGHTRALLLDEQRLAHATRIACTVGGACAMTVIFNAPFGGLLYMFEEVTSVSWPLELTFRVFVSTMCSSLLSYALCSLMGSSINEFVIYAEVSQTKTWQWEDIPLFVLVAVFMGIFTSLHTRGMLSAAKFRQSTTMRFARWQPTAKIVETAIYGAVCALTSALVSLLGTCTPKGDSGLKYVTFNCAEGEYNPIASLLVATSHSSVKLLFSGSNAGEISCSASFLAFLTYSTLNIGLGGLPVPGGAFTATMLMGAMFGRSMGALMQSLGVNVTVSGVYAVVGSASMLCGFKQMTLASVLIVVECVNDLNLAPIVMLGVVISMSINWMMNERGHDEVLILRKKLPFLEAEAPHELEHRIALDLCDPLPSETVLAAKTSIASVVQALEQTTICYFPIMDESRNLCRGIITRPHLEGILAATTPPEPILPSVQPQSMISLQEPVLPAVARSPSSPRSLTSPSSPRLQLSPREQAQETFPDTEMFAWSYHQVDASAGIPLDEIMDPTPFTILEDTPAPRLYAMFAKAGERAACVTSRTGEFRGIISREGLVAASRPAVF